MWGAHWSKFDWFMMNFVHNYTKVDHIYSVSKLVILKQILGEKIHFLTKLFQISPFGSLSGHLVTPIVVGVFVALPTTNTHPCPLPITTVGRGQLMTWITVPPVEVVWGQIQPQTITFNLNLGCFRKTEVVKGLSNKSLGNLCTLDQNHCDGPKSSWKNSII